MNFEECIDWLYSFEKFGIKLGLERIIYICKKLGDPQNNFKVIHVGGTNGKGSVCKFLESILVKSGYNVGVYTSPHLQRFSERFVVNNEEISESELVILIEKVKPIVDDMVLNKNTPTFFEIVTAMTFQYFKDKKVEFAIIEVGLGGRFDATNIVTPMVSIITNVSLDHQDRLGNKIEDIAFEKAGIIKSGIPVITAARGAALDIIKKISEEKNSDITIVERDSWRKKSGSESWQEFLISCPKKDYKVTTFMFGKYQGENIAITLSTVEALQINGVYITDKSIYDGLEKIKNPGRMEIVSFEPMILLDGAHNVTGMSILKESIEEGLNFSGFILILGILKDKNIKEILDVITPIADVIITTKSHNLRACDPAILKDMIQDKEVVIIDDISKAVDYAKSIASIKDIICITGSLFTVGEARDHIFKKTTKMLIK
jgi:dihydrofolate synthase/folylpolyglutamate synthase